ncbi:MAG: GAF domain-containing protein [Anaerolineae bacterium]|nr:GAF domain-containing protein [Anaerolineae bacterium]
MRYPRRYRRTIGRLLLISVGANVCGGALIMFHFYNLYSVAPQQTAAGSPLALGAAVMVALLLLGNMLTDRWLSPLWKWYRQAAAGEAEQAPLPVCRLALNWTAISAATTFGMWMLATLIFGLLNGLDLAARRFDAPVFFEILTGGIIAGSVTTALEYFLAESAWSSELELFFPHGGLTRVDSFRLPLRVRMLILFIVGSAPLLSLAILSYNQALQIAHSPQPAALLPRLLRLELAFAGSGLLASIVLARSLAASVVRPLETLSQRMIAVTAGDLDSRVPVASNDEIGVVSTCFNDMVASLKQREIELQTVYQISQEITASLELEQTMETVLRRVRQMIAYDGAGVYLYDGERQLFDLRAVAVQERISTCAGERVHRIGEGSVGWMGEHRRSRLVSDLAAAPDLPPPLLLPGDEEKSYVGVPLLADQRIVGALELVSRQETAFDSHDLQLLETIAPQASIAIGNAVQVLERERQLKAQIEQLRIEINEARRAQQVEEVTETEYFRHLQQQARDMRRRGEADR